MLIPCQITPRNFAYSTVSTRLPSMTMLGIEFLTLSSGVKQITVSFDFGEWIFIQLFWVQSTVDSCITDTSFVLKFQIAYCRQHKITICTKEHVTLDH